MGTAGPGILRAKVLGFCMGVRRAVRLAYRAADSAGRVCTLGPLIHNPQVLDDLKARGVETLPENGGESRLPENLEGVSVVVRAHGVGPETERELRRRGAVLIDATCPRVKTCQLKAMALAEAGYLLFLAGEKTHAEISGIVGYAEAGALRRGDCRPECVVVGNAAEALAEAERLAAKLRAENPKTALIGQTTISETEYRDIAGAVAKVFPALEVAQTICTATRERQDSLRELLAGVDALVVVGGRESANTRRLFAIAEAAGKPCVLAESADDVPPEFRAAGTVGITAGASTPDAVIDAVELALRRTAG